MLCHQGHIEAIFADDLASHGIKIGRSIRFIDHKKSENEQFPLIARLKDETTGMVSEVPTKYILACDGTGSSVRQDLGIQSDIQEMPKTWAVADTHVATDFPDVRRRCNIRTEQGSVMFVPLANNGIRIDTLLSRADVSILENSKYHGKGYSDKNEETLIGIISKRVKAILNPYKIDIVAVDWVSMYHNTQRVVKAFADPANRVFILGDACHTHSPKSGQGMNISMTDSYNFTWKLALHMRSLAKPELLKSYEIERHYIAKQLIEYDHKWSTLFASSENQHTSEFLDTFVQGKAFTSGVGHCYPPGILVTENVGVDIDQQALEPLTPGKRLYPIALTVHISGNRTNLLDELPSNGKFHIFVFAGKSGALGGDLAVAAEYLASPASPLTYHSKHTQTNRYDGSRRDLATDPDRLVDLYLIHTQDHLYLRVEAFPDPFPDWQSRIYEDVHGKGHEELGLNDQGAFVVVRPDGYVGLITSLAGGEEVGEYFEGFLKL